MPILQTIITSGLSFNDWIKTLSTARQDAFKAAVEANSVLFADFVENVQTSNIGPVFSDQITHDAYHSIRNNPTWLAFWMEWESIYGKPTFETQPVLIQESTVDKWIPNVESGIGNVKVNVTVITTTAGTIIGKIT
jgi:hypothetical protein